MIDIRIFDLPKRKMFEGKSRFSKRLEDEIESLVKCIPYDYNVSAEVISVQVTSNSHGNPKYVLITVSVPLLGKTIDKKPKK